MSTFIRVTMGTKACFLFCFWKWEVGSRKSEVGSRKADVGRWNSKSEVGRPFSAFVVRFLFFCFLVVVLAGVGLLLLLLFSLEQTPVSSTRKDPFES